MWCVVCALTLTLTPTIVYYPKMACVVCPYPNTKPNRMCIVQVSATSGVEYMQLMLPVSSTSIQQTIYFNHTLDLAEA